MVASKAWLLGALERALKTMAQTLIALIGTEAVGITSLDWPSLLSVAATATLLSVLTSIVNADFTAGSGADSAVGSGEVDV